MHRLELGKRSLHHGLRAAVPFDRRNQLLAAGDRLIHRRRSLHRADRVRDGPAPLLPDVTGQLGMTDDSLGRLESRVEAQREDVGIPAHAPRGREPDVILGGLEDRDRTLDLGVGSFGPAVLVSGVEVDEKADEAGTGDGRPAGGIVLRRLDLAKHVVCAVEIAALHQGLAQVRRQGEPRRIHLRQASHGPGEKVGCRRQVATGEGTPASGTELLGSSRPEDPDVRVDRPELAPIRVGPLEVVSDNLVHLDLGIPRPVGLLEPVGEPFVQVGAPSLEDPLVRRVTDEDVLEPIVRPVGIGRQLLAHEALADDRGEVLRHLVTVGRAREVPDGDGGKRLADDRRRLHDGPLVGLEQVEPRREQGVDARRHGQRVDLSGDLHAPIGLPQDAGIDEHRDELLDEQRVAVGSVEDAILRGGRQLEAPDPVLEHDRGGLTGQTLQEQSSGTGALAPLRAVGEHVGPRGADDEHGSVDDAVDEMLDQLEQGRGGPMNVVDDHDHRPASRHRLQERPDAPEELGHRELFVVPAERGAHAPGDLGVVGQNLEVPHRRVRSLLRPDSCGVANDLHQRPEGDALPVRQTPTSEHGGSVLGAGEHLPHEPALPHTGLAQHGGEPAAAVTDRRDRASRRRTASSRSRPTSGASWSRSDCSSPKTRSSRCATTAMALPLRSSGGIGSDSTAPRTSRRVGSPRKISFSPAACSRRAAVLSVSPVRTCWSFTAVRTTTSPVWTPMRIMRVTPYAPSSWPLRRVSASRISTAARTARSASSSWSSGMPKAATTASPMNFWIDAPWRSRTRVIVVK